MRVLPLNTRTLPSISHIYRSKGGGGLLATNNLCNQNNKQSACQRNKTFVVLDLGSRGFQWSLNRHSRDHKKILFFSLEGLQKMLGCLRFYYFKIYIGAHEVITLVCSVNDSHARWYFGAVMTLGGSSPHA